MSDKVVTIPILPELPVGTVFRFQGKKTRYRVVEVDSDKVINHGYSVCDDCAFQPEAWSRDFRYCNSFICAGLDRKDRTYVRAERIASGGKKSPEITDVFEECGG